MPTGTYEQRMAKALERFERKTVEMPGPLDTPCMLWTGAINRSHGYGHITFLKRRWRVHRFAWWLYYGEEPPADLMVCHKCDVKHCVARDHLFLGTALDNVRDMVGKGRASLSFNDPDIRNKALERRHRKCKV